MTGDLDPSGQGASSVSIADLHRATIADMAVTTSSAHFGNQSASEGRPSAERLCAPPKEPRVCASLLESTSSGAPDLTCWKAEVSGLNLP
jgi:hypothetical protein